MPMMATIDQDPDRIQPWHDVTDESKYVALAKSMEAAGWVGAPIVVITPADGDPAAISGSHRIAAARSAGIEIPTVELDDLLHAAGTSLAELDDSHGNLEGDHFEAIVHLDEHLSAEVVEYYGFDVH